MIGPTVSTIYVATMEGMIISDLYVSPVMTAVGLLFFLFFLEPMLVPVKSLQMLFMLLMIVMILMIETGGPVMMK